MKPRPLRRQLQVCRPQTQRQPPHVVSVCEVTARRRLSLWRLQANPLTGTRSDGPSISLGSDRMLVASRVRSAEPLADTGDARGDFSAVIRVS